MSHRLICVRFQVRHLPEVPSNHSSPLPDTPNPQRERVSAREGLEPYMTQK